MEPPVVYLDGGMSSDIYLENEDDVRKYHELVEVIRQTALDETSTRNLLRQVAREHDGEC
nr:Scr1 family TA system antitoxin-like transcriptional regulator [Nocardia violaceofusca]